MNKKNLGLIALFILLIAAVVLLTVNMLERRSLLRGASRARSVKA